jgi:hypothetical protein
MDPHQEPLFYQPPESTNLNPDKPYNENLLPEELLNELDTVKPEAGDINIKGIVDKNKLNAAAVLSLSWLMTNYEFRESFRQNLNCPSIRQ